MKGKNMLFVLIYMFVGGLNTNLLASENDSPIVIHDAELESLYNSFIVGEMHWKEIGKHSYVNSTVDITAARGVVESDVVVKQLYALSSEKVCTAQFQGIKQYESEYGGYIPLLSYAFNGGEGCLVGAQYFLSTEPTEKYKSGLYLPSTLSSSEKKLLKHQDNRAMVYARGDDKIVISNRQYVTRIREGKAYELFSGYGMVGVGNYPSLERDILSIQRGYIADLDNDGNIEVLISSGTGVYATISLNEISNHKRDELLEISWADEGGETGFARNYSIKLLKKH